MALCPEHPERDQNPRFTPLSETTSIPVCLIWESPPPPPPAFIEVLKGKNVSFSQFTTGNLLLLLLLSELGILFFIWIASIAYGLAFLLLGARLHHILSAAVFSACMIINLLAYFIIYRIARRHHVQIQAQEQIQARQENGTLNMSAYRKSVINIFLLSTLFVLCCVPYIFVRVYISFADLSRNRRMFAARLSASSMYLNSLFNPLLYCWRMRDLRMGMKSFVKAWC